MKRNPYLGYWKITGMELWDADYIDLVVPGFIQFDLGNDYLHGEFQFGTIAGWLDCRLREVAAESFIEWSWEGHNDNDPGCGRGWATLKDGELVGRVFIHRGDDSEFTAERQPPPRARGRRRTVRT